MSHRLRGEGGGASHQRGRFSPPVKAVCLFSHGQSPVVKVLFILAAQPPTTTLMATGHVKLKHPRGESPVKPLNPHARKGVSIKSQAAEKPQKMDTFDRCPFFH